MPETFTEYDASTLPEVVLTYLDARDVSRHADAAAAFASEATVVDDGNTYQGIDAISAWTQRSSTEYSYTSTRIGQQIDDAHAVVLIRLDGDFPGGTATLRHRFEHEAGLIHRLVIEV